MLQSQQDWEFLAPLDVSDTQIHYRIFGQFTCKSPKEGPLIIFLSMSDLITQ